MNQYFDTIKEQAEKYLQGDWRRFLAQLWRESRLDPKAISKKGAIGIAQILPGTWLDICRDLGWNFYDPGISPYNPELSIEAGAYYMGKLWKVWTAPRPEEDRRCLAEASYNAGLSRCLAAQERSGNKNLWKEIRPFLPIETQNYVDAIRYHWHITFKDVE